MRAARTVSLILVGTMVGLVLTGPAGAHLGRLKHLIKHLTKTFYTEPEADALFLTQGEAEGQFLAEDVVRLSQNGPWYGDGGTIVGYQSDQVIIDRGASGATHLDSHLPLLSPVQVGGQSYGLKELEICYRLVDGDDKIDYTEVRDNRTDSNIVVDDQTDRTATEYACYTVGPPSPVVPTGSLTLTVRNTTDDTASDNILFRSVTTTWVPV